VTGDFLGKVVVFGGVDIVDGGGEDGNGSSSGEERSAMGGGIDAAREAADDGESGASERAGKAFGLLLSVEGATSGADDADGEIIARGEIASAVENEGRIGNLGEAMRIAAPVADEHLDLSISAGLPLFGSGGIFACGGEGLEHAGLEIGELGEFFAGSAEDISRRFEAIEKELEHARGQARRHLEAEGIQRLGIGSCRIDGHGTVPELRFRGTADCNSEKV